MSAPRDYPTPDDSAPLRHLPPEIETAAEGPAEAGPAVPEPASPDPSSGRVGPRMRRTVDGSRFSLLVVAILVGSALFVGGFTLGARVSTTPGTPASQEAQFAPFWDVYSLIKADFAGSPRPNEDQLVRAAITGMMQALNDPWSDHQSPEDFNNTLLNVGGQAVGIGVMVQLQPVQAGSSISCAKIGNGCEMAITAPIPGSPAAAAGILAADVISGVDGKSLDGLSSDDAVALIKGPKGTPVTLTILRGSRTLDVTIVRNVYDVPQVLARSLANGQVAYISIAGINDPAYSQFHLALSNAVAAGQKSIILDLRGNLGGYIPDAVKIASDFVSSGPILYQEDSSGTQTEIDANPNGLAIDPSIKLVVLVDKNTASSAEIAAGALQARGRARLVGEKTYGKGVFQEYLPLEQRRRHPSHGRTVADAEQGLGPGQGAQAGHRRHERGRPGGHRPGSGRGSCGAWLSGRTRSSGQPIAGGEPGARSERRTFPPAFDRSVGRAFAGSEPHCELVSSRGAELWRAQRGSGHVGCAIAAAPLPCPRTKGGDV